MQYIKKILAKMWTILIKKQRTKNQSWTIRPHKQYNWAHKEDKFWLIYIGLLFQLF